MIPYSRLKRPDLYTLSHSEQLEDHTFTAAHTYIAHIWQPPARFVPLLYPVGLKMFCYNFECNL